MHHENSYNTVNAIHPTTPAVNTNATTGKNISTVRGLGAERRTMLKRSSVSNRHTRTAIKPCNNKAEVSVSATI
jgi:hypothetical protein